MRKVLTLMLLASAPLIHGCAAIALGGAAATAGYVVGEETVLLPDFDPTQHYQLTVNVSESVVSRKERPI